MCRVLRIALMWLLALALPVQGVVAATMLACGPGHSMTAPTAVEMPASHHAPVVHAHEHGDDAAAAHDMAEHDGGAAHVPSQKCSACASCCTAAMLPTPSPVFGAAELPDFVAPAVPADLVLFLTDGPERPPRTFLD